MTKSRIKKDDETKIQGLTAEVKNLKEAIKDQAKLAEMYTIQSKHETRITVVEHDIKTVKDGVTGIKEALKKIAENFTKQHAFMAKYENDGPRVLRFIQIFLGIIFIIITAGISYIGWYTQDSKKTERGYQKQIIEFYMERGKK